MKNRTKGLTKKWKLVAEKMRKKASSLVGDYVQRELGGNGIDIVRRIVY